MIRSLLRPAAYRAGRSAAARTGLLSLARPPPAVTGRPYSRTAAALDGDDGAGSGPAPRRRRKSEAHEERRRAAADYNSRRAAYRRDVTHLRRAYADEVAAQRAQDKAAAEARQRELTRLRLERQRRKNLRSSQHALHQERERRERAREFEEHLRAEREKREAKQALFDQARQLAIDELERESPLWLTTPEEVEAAFSHEAGQLLWARPGGILGAANPSLDSHFWNLETHTWHMDRTYKSQRDMLAEQLQEQAYSEANVDPDFWTPERVEEHERREEKARLRAMVHASGRLELLKRQRQMLLDDAEAEAASESLLPKPAPVPNLRMLQDHEALEREGARLLLEDPTKFFVFDGAASGGAGHEGSEDSSSYAGPSLGAPVGLRDQLREGSHQNTVYPVLVGRPPPEDTRTERQKKQQEREERLWAAAQAQALAKAGDGTDMEIELAAQQQTLEDLEPDLNYDEVHWDWQEDEWKKGTDPVADADILNVPREQRYTEDDIEWVAKRLEAKVSHLERQFSQDVESLKRVIESQARMETGLDKPFDESSLEAALLALPDRELVALSDLDDRHAAGDLSDEEMIEAAKAVPGLSEEQIRAVLDRNRSTSA